MEYREINARKLAGIAGLIILFMYTSDLLSALLLDIVVSRFVVVFLWGIGLWYTLNWTKKKDIFQDLFNFDLNKRVTLSAIVVVSINFMDNLLPFNDLTPQILVEYSHLISEFGNLLGNIGIIILSVYYLFETLLMLFVLGFFQSAADMKFKKKYIPWGGLGIGFTWGYSISLTGS